MAPKRDPKALKTKILLSALPDVAFDGWSEELLERACAKLKISPAVRREVLPGGVTELVRYFSAWADDETLKKLGGKKLSALRVRDKIALGVRTRLEILAPCKQAVSSALAYMGTPPRGFSLPRLVWATADHLWWAAGDTATDYNHYTKRILLSGVITSTTLYWLNDSSKNHENTWTFLDRRIENVLKIGQKIASFKNRTAGAA